MRLPGSSASSFPNFRNVTHTYNQSQRTEKQDIKRNGNVIKTYEPPARAKKDIQFCQAAGTERYFSETTNHRLLNDARYANRRRRRRSPMPSLSLM